MVSLERTRGFETITVTQKKFLVYIVKRKVILGVEKTQETCVVPGGTRYTYGVLL